MQSPQHTIELEVRDYECDYQGRVNNAVYQNYLEHARHSCLRTSLNVPELSRQGIDLVIAESKLRYLHPLRPHQRFRIHSNYYLQGNFRLIFEQNITLPDDTEVLRAKVSVAALQNGRPCPFSQISQISQFIGKVQ